MKISYNWLKWYVPEIPEAESLVDVFNYHLCEVEGVEKLSDGDTIFDINILPHRAHDLLSHHGIGMELAGQLGLAYQDPRPKYKTITDIGKTNLKIDIQTDKCRRYMGRIVRNIKVGPSPDWVVKHLESIGQRSINNIVDATNLTMFDCGQPTHAFDTRKVRNYELRITNAKDGEELELLGSEKMKVKLQDSDMVITDGEGKTLALAGVKGGLDSGIAEDTTELMLEVANFDPVTVRRTGARLGILSDARKRFENDLSPEAAAYGMMELSALIAEMCPDAVFEEIVDVNHAPYEEKKIEFTVEYINHHLGSAVTGEMIEDIFKRYSWTFVREGELFTFTVPCMRLDLTGPHDLAEEIGRILGYDKITPVLPKIDFAPKANPVFLHILHAREKLLKDEYSEVMTYGFRNTGDVEVLASASDKKFLRTNLSDGIKEAILLNERNLPLLNTQAKIFEIGTVFTKKGEMIHVAYGDKKNLTEMSLEEFIKTHELEVASGETYGDLLPASQLHHHTQRFSMWSLYPFITRDISIWVPTEVESGKVYKVIKENAGELLVYEPKLVDEYKKEDKVSYAFRLVFQAPDRTLTDVEVNAVMDKIAAKIKEEENWQIR